mgnify:FL=1
MLADECLSELPIRGRGFKRDEGLPVARGDLEGEGLTVEIGIALPVLAPIAGHWEPAGAGALDRHRRHISGTAHIGYKDQVEEGMAIHREMDASILLASNPKNKIHKK